MQAERDVTWLLLHFARGGPAAYLSHLDTARAVQRTFARAGVPIALSQGMRPKPRLSLPLPLPVGVAGRDELAVVEVPDGQPGTAAALRALRAASPPGLSRWRWRSSATGTRGHRPRSPRVRVPP